MVSINSVIASAVIANLTRSSEDLKKSLINLSSGIKSNASVADYAIGTTLSTQSSTLTTANLNAGQGKSLLQTAKGSLDQVLTLLQEQKALAVQAEDGTLTTNELANLNNQFQALTAEIDRLVNTTKFNNKTLLDGTISGAASLTTVTGLAGENYSILDHDNDYSFSGTTAAGELDATSGETFDILESDEFGKTAASTTITLTHDGGGALTANATFEVGGVSVSFGSGDTTAAQLGGSLVAALEASTSNVIRRFTYADNGDGTITVTGADLGTANSVDSTTFEMTGDGTGAGGTVATATLANSADIDSSDGGGAASTITANNGDGATIATNRTVAAADETYDESLQGAFSSFTAALDTSGTQNKATFTVDVNGVTYTSQAVTLFGGSGDGFNGKGNTIKNGQLLYFYNSDGPTDANGEYTDNGFTLKIDDAAGASDDITITGGDQDAFELDLSNTATAFATQLTDNRINQRRDIILSEDNPSASDFDIAAATGTTFAGIEGFDLDDGTTKGDILFVGDTFGDDGRLGSLGAFSFNSATDTISVTINDEVYTADISDNTANTGGIVDGAGSYNSTTKILTAGAGTTIVFHSAATNDGRQLRVDLSNLTDTSIELNSTTAIKTFTDDFDTLLGVSGRESLSFQVGSGSTNTIGLSIDSALTTDIYIDDQGVAQTLSIATTAGATEAQEVLDNAINTVLGLISTTSSGITSFDSAITVNNIMIQNFDATSASLLNTNYAEESTNYAELTLKINAAVASLAQEQARLQNILSLLSFS